MRSSPRSASRLRDEALWYAANRAAGRDLVLAGGANLVLSVALPVDGIAYSIVMVVALAAGIAFVVLTNLARVRALHRLPL